ncbi:MAG: putative lipopolysaccharide heptosyltransferase III, partial [Nitrospirae bacterium]|nr:putative lipopolysaccharide heptosyltransferase III [Nitrospirota bacterium]
MNFRGIEKILVIKLRHIGDVLLAVPVFRALRENFPQAHIAALINSGTEDVLTGNPFINEIIVFDRSVKKLSLSRRLWEESIFLRGIKNKHFDMTVDLTGGDRPAIISFISGARYRLGYVTRKKNWLKKNIYTHLVRKNGSQHIVMQNLDVVKQFGISTDNLHIDFFVPEEARSFVRRIFRENNIKDSDTVVHVHPTSRWLFKCWKDEYMAEVINWLIEHGIKVIVTSAPGKRETEKAKRILSLIPSRITHHASRLIDLCGKTTIKQLAAISRASDLFIGVDSAPMHIAAAVGTPVIALFGPTKENRWGPWGNIHTVISK